MKKLLIICSFIAIAYASNAQTTPRDYSPGGTNTTWVSKYNLKVAGKLYLKSVSAVLNFDSTATLTSSDLGVSYPGAAVGDYVIVSVPVGSLVANSSYTGYVFATDSVKIRLNNYSAGTINPASGTFKVAVIKYY